MIMALISLNDNLERNNNNDIGFRIPSKNHF